MTTNCYFKRGSSFIPTNEDDLNLQYDLPGETFIIKENPQTGELYFEQITTDYEFAHRIYGKTVRHANRIMATFEDRPASTGIALVGEKGSGKTMLARLLSKMGSEKKYPTIVINQPFVGEKFNKLIQDVKQPCIVLFDEFEKVYDPEKQEQVLTLLDGVFPSKKMFILTSNDASRIDLHMRNRPGRIFYMLDFTGVDEDQIREYCTANLGNKEHVEEIVKISKLFSKFNFDMMKAMVEEMNRYNEDPHEVMEMLNARPTTDTEGEYQVLLTHKGKPVTTIWPRSLSRNPLSSDTLPFSFTLAKDAGDTPEVDDFDDSTVTFRQEHLVAIDPKNGVFTYDNGNGMKLVCTRVTAKFTDLRSILNITG